MDGKQKFGSGQIENNEIEDSFSDEDYYDEEGSNENEGALDKTVIYGAYEKIIKEEP